MNDDNSEDIYRQSLLVYLDILGFKCEIEQSIADKNKRIAIRNLLQLQKSLEIDLNSIRTQNGTPLQKEIPNIQVRAFSDTIVITHEYPSSMVFHAIAYITSIFQLQAVENGYFLRGAMVYADSYQDKDIIFGPAIVKAYELERGLAEWPRVLIHSSVLANIPPNVFKIMDSFYLLREDDGLTYLNYLRFLYLGSLLLSGTSKSINIPTTQIPDKEIFSYHRKAIQKAVERISTKRPYGLDIMVKYHTLSSYHNKVIDKLGEDLSDVNKFTKMNRNERKNRRAQLMKSKIDLVQYFSELYTYR